MVRDGQLLLVRRTLEPWRGAWCGPAGFCDGDEHPIRTAERETYEESGIPAHVTGFLGIWTDRYPAATNTDVDDTIAVVWYHAVPTDGEPGTPDPAEVDAVAWFSPDRLPSRVAPPSSFPRVLAAWRSAFAAGATVTPLPDRPYE